MADVAQRPGWYPDPDGVPGERWWNGAGWSDSRRGGVNSPPPVIYSAENPAPQAPNDRPVPTIDLRGMTSVNTRLNPAALYGFIAGLIGLFFNFLLVPSILAIVFSARGLVRANQLNSEGLTPNLRVFAVIGLVLGIFGSVTGLVQAIIVIVTIIGSFSVTVS